jgi:Fur family ferric uptake transcriptional regulator
MQDKFNQFLKSSGNSITPARLAVFNFLRQNDPTDISDVVAGCSEIDRASVYRALALFRDLKIVTDSIISGRKMLELTDSFDAHHHHISCLNCGHSVTTADEKLEAYLSEIARAHGITPTSHHVEISGLCSNCRKSVLLQ